MFSYELCPCIFISPKIVCVMDEKCNLENITAVVSRIIRPSCVFMIT